MDMALDVLLRRRVPFAEEGNNLTSCSLWTRLLFQSITHSHRTQMWRLGQGRKKSDSVPAPALPSTDSLQDMHRKRSIPVVSCCCCCWKEFDGSSLMQGEALRADVRKEDLGMRSNPIALLPTRTVADSSMATVCSEFW